MCPACLTAAALIVAGTTSAGGLTALIATRFRPKIDGRPPSSHAPSAGRPNSGLRRSRHDPE